MERSLTSKATFCIITLTNYFAPLSSFPSHTCPSKTYLTEEEFNKVLGMSVQEFRALPKWKQGNLKKKVDLF